MRSRGAWVRSETSHWRAPLLRKHANKTGAIGAEMPFAHHATNGPEARRHSKERPAVVLHPPLAKHARGVRAAQFGKANCQAAASLAG